MDVWSYLVKLFGKGNVSKEGKTITVRTEKSDRKYRSEIAVSLAKKFKGKEKNRVVTVGQIKIRVKPQTKQGAKSSPSTINYAHLKDFLHSKESYNTSDFSGVCEPVYNKSLPTNIKEKSDVFIVNELNKLIKKKTDEEHNQEQGTTLTIADKTYKNVICCVPIIRGDEPKADICLVCLSGNKLVPKGFFSYKLGSSPTDFGGYSGITLKAGKNIFEHPEVESFIKELDRYSKTGKLWSNKAKTDLKFEPYRPIKSSELQKMAVFGPDAGNTSFGVNNCEAILQGVPRLQGNTVSFDHVQKKSDRNFSEGYRPVLGARKATDRGFHYNDIVLTNLRIGIFQDGYRGKWKNKDKDTMI